MLYKSVREEVTRQVLGGGSGFRWCKVYSIVEGIYVSSDIDKGAGSLWEAGNKVYQLGTASLFM